MMSSEQKILILSTGLFPAQEELIREINSSKKFTDSEFIKLTPEMSEQDWDTIVQSLLNCDKLISI